MQGPRPTAAAEAAAAGTGAGATADPIKQYTSFLTHTYTHVLQTILVAALGQQPAKWFKTQLKF